MATPEKKRVLRFMDGTDQWMITVHIKEALFETAFFVYNRIVRELCSRMVTKKKKKKKKIYQSRVMTRRDYAEYF